MAETDRVLIAGGGPVGLIAALLLARADIPVVVCEAEAEPIEDLRASTFHPPTLDMLDGLGITQRLIDEGLIAPSWQIRDRKTGPVVTLDMAALRNDTAHPYRVQCEQWRLVRFALADLAAYDHAEVLFGHRATGLRQDGSGVTLEVAGPEGAVCLAGRYLIGADGAASAVRTALGVEFEGFTFEELFLSVSTQYELADHFPQLTYINYISDPEEWLVLLRVKSLWRVLFPVAPDLAKEVALSDAFIEARMQSLLARPEPYEIAHRTLYRIHQRVAQKYRAGRVFLAGDAAHINNPLGGMGLNGGLHDAFNLGERLVKVWNGGDRDLLDQYERQRRPVAIEYVKEATMRNQRLMSERDPDKRAAALDELRQAAEDPDATYAMMLRASMIDAVRRAAAIP
ncbi:MAG TPA: FAD-dependent monooxygenase [Alphaproteobacteria bacterium]|nr:FAD-dependent monooxygenase [Alphaproteobacteria bacterium]